MYLDRDFHLQNNIQVTSLVADEWFFQIFLKKNLCLNLNFLVFLRLVHFNLFIIIIIKDCIAIINCLDIKNFIHSFIKFEIKLLY